MSLFWIFLTQLILKGETNGSMELPVLLLRSHRDGDGENVGPFWPYRYTHTQVAVYNRNDEMGLCLTLDADCSK